MKNLKKLSRNDLKSLTGGKNGPARLASDGGCEQMCTRTGGGTDVGCRQYELSCGLFECGGQLIHRCM